MQDERGGRGAAAELIAQATLRVLDLGVQDYGRAWQFQEQTAALRREDAGPDTLMLLEHPPVYTLGRNARETNLLRSPEDLARLGCRVVRTSRGGDVTFHGPGQLVGYPILDLAALGRTVVEYVGGLEEALIRTLKIFAIEGHRDPIHRGVWVGGAKIAAIGVRVARRVTTHGFALNVTTDLRWFDHIVPCGLAGRGVTAMERFVPGLTVDAVKPVLIREFCGVFGYRTFDLRREEFKGPVGASRTAEGCVAGVPD